jgi:hypothetical protein
LITLSFRPLQNGPTILVRGAHFRICADGTLRGPDNSVAARYLDSLWYLGQRRHGSFDCTGPILLRVTNQRGQRECIGPYDSIRTTAGTICTEDVCLGIHAARDQHGAAMLEVWQEVSFLTPEESVIQPR